MSTDSEPPPSSRTIKASEFKAKCLKLMDEVTESHSLSRLSRRCI